MYRLYFSSNPVYTACKLISQLLNQYRIKIIGKDLNEMDKSLWTFSACEFIPHTLHENYISIDVKNEKEITMSIYEAQKVFASFLYDHEINNFDHSQYKVFKQS